MSPELAPILSLQLPCGAFASEIDFTARSAERGTLDANAFVTSQVVLALLDVRDDAPGLSRALERALDFIESCEDPARPGAFAFYPSAARARETPSPHLELNLPPDADDTALSWVALVRGGRRSVRRAREALLQHLSPIAPGCVRRGDPAWVRPGALRTWLVDGPDNPVDLCVNLNALFACHVCGLDAHPLTRAILPSVRAGLALAGASSTPPRLLFPYYAHRAELGIALLRTSSAGARALGPMAARLCELDAQDRRDQRPSTRPLYCDVDGWPRWRSPALQGARRAVDSLNLRLSEPSASSGCAPRTHGDPR